MEMKPWTLLFLLLAVSWGNAAGECPKPILEDNLVLSDTAILKNNFPDGSDITLECATGHEVDTGSNIISCLDGKWSQQELICKKKDCGYPKEIPHVKYEITSGTLFGAHIKSYCDQGYYLQGSSYRQCLVSGWTGRPRCFAITCGTPPEIPHSSKRSGLTTENLAYKDEIEYSCETKYTLIGNKFVVCQEDGKYSSLPQCKADCPSPVLEGSVVLKNSSTLNDTFPHGSEVALTCAPGHMKVQGSANITCNNGEWDELELSCQTITCGEPPEIPHSTKHRTKENLEYKDEIEYSCDAKYTLIGNTFVVCQEDGKYSSLPQCKADCPSPVLEESVMFQNSATLNDTFPHGSEVALTCAPGHVKVQGSANITCNNGEWNEPELSCQRSGVLTNGSNAGKMIGGLIGTLVAVGLLALFVKVISPKYKSKGSYDTGEEKRLKKGLAQENFTQIPI